jgi:DNA polymerase III subunit delta
MNYAQFLQLIKHSEPQPLYILVGPETFLRRLAIHELSSRFVAKEAYQLNYSSFGDSTDDVTAALATAKSRPMCSPMRMIHLSGTGLGNKAQAELVETYLQRPSPKSVVVLEIEELRKDSALSVLIRKQGALVDCQRLKPQECSAWLTQYAKAQGYTLLPEACALLLSRVGNNLQELVNNLDKVFSYAGEPSRVTRQQVQEVVGESRELPLWELSDAVTRGDASGVLNILDSCFRQGEVPLVLITVIHKVFRQVLLAREMLESGGDAHEVGRALRIPEFKLSAFLRSVKSMPAEWAGNMYSASAEVDDLMKSSSTPPRILLEALVCRAASGIPRPPRKISEKR